MPTDKPRVTFTVSQETLEKIEDYRFSNKSKNQTQAILSLIEKGLSVFEPDIKSSPSDLTEEELKVAKDYSSLDEHGKSMVRVVISEEQKRILETGRILTRSMIQAAARGGGVKQIKESRPDEVPNDDEPIP